MLSVFITQNQCLSVNLQFNVFIVLFNSFRKGTITFQLTTLAEAIQNILLVFNDFKSLVCNHDSKQGGEIIHIVLQKKVNSIKKKKSQIQ